MNRNFIVRWTHIVLKYTNKTFTDTLKYRPDIQHKEYNVNSLDKIK